MKYLVSEIFHSVQGEGNYAGANSLFIRFQICNLTCKWCDSKYTWNRKSGIFKEYSDSELKQIIKDSNAHNVIFTGGEPALYNLDRLVVKGRMYHVESNGSIDPLKPYSAVLSDGIRVSRYPMREAVIKQFNWVISPKLKNAGVDYYDSCFRIWLQKRYAVFKFVVQTPGDLDEIHALAGKFRLRPHRIFVGIEGTTLQSQLRSDLVEEIVKRGWNFSPRLHVILWENTRRH